MKGSTAALKNQRTKLRKFLTGTKGTRTGFKPVDKRLRVARSKALKRRKAINAELAKRRGNRHPSVKDVKLTGKTGAGHPNWGGGHPIITQVVTPTAEAHGLFLSSAKRPSSHSLSISNPGSDHNEANLTAAAGDYAIRGGGNIPLEVGNKAFKAIAKALGIPNATWGHWNPYFITVDGIRFRVQLGWQVSGHWDHIHVGIKRV